MIEADFWVALATTLSILCLSVFWLGDVNADRMAIRRSSHDTNQQKCRKQENDNEPLEKSIILSRVLTVSDVCISSLQDSTQPIKLG